jgi:uncharacterized protein with HEPN domain
LSETERVSSDERAREALGHVIENADQIARYVEGIDFEAFRAEAMRRDAIERCLERIIEACVRVGQERLDQIVPGMLLHQVRGFGNRKRHEYDRINSEIVWQTATETIPALREACAKAAGERG